jgi:Fur family transcriptional regulator, ferric uptake regulator
MKKNSQHQSLDDYQKHFSAAGLRWTSARKEVLRILLEGHSLLSIDEIHVKALKSADWSTIYRTLNLFVEKGWVTSTDFGDGIQRFEVQHPKHHHHHIICSKCKNIEVIEVCAVSKIEKELNQQGYKNVSHQLEFFGVCPSCK